MLNLKINDLVNIKDLFTENCILINFEEEKFKEFCKNNSKVFRIEFIEKCTIYFFVQDSFRHFLYIECENKSFILEEVYRSIGYEIFENNFINYGFKSSLILNLETDNYKIFKTSECQN